MTQSNDSVREEVRKILGDGVYRHLEGDVLKLIREEKIKVLESLQTRASTLQTHFPHSSTQAVLDVLGIDEMIQQLKEQP